MHRVPGFLAARLACAAAFALAQGCTSIGHERVEGWPALRVVEHRVPHAQMRERCARYVGPGLLTEACAEFYLARAECHVWLSRDFPPPRAVVEHERLHCAGFDHPGERALSRILARHRARLAELARAPYPANTASTP